MIKVSKAAAVVCTVALGVVLAASLAACGGSSQSSSSSSAGDETSVSYKTTAEGKYATGTHHATVSVKGFDPFVIELDADSAPVTVANFCELAESKFYEGVGFHRIVEGFCLQGGDPTGTGAGGSGQEILGEYSGNGVENPLADDFKKGTVAMARSSLPNSASSQFFITLDSSDQTVLSLNKQYAAFGTVDKAGMKVVDKIVDKYAAKAGANGVISDTGDMPIIESVEITD